jgi:hypothetical protein
MPFTDTRLGPGTLLLGTAPGEEFGFQVSNIRLVPAVDSTDGTPTLAVPDPAPESTTTYSLDGSAINDFAVPGGLQRYCFDNDGDTVDFSFTSSTVDGTTLAGQVQIHAFEMGGDVGTQLVTDFSWPVVGKPTFTDLPLAAGASKSKAASS